MTLCVAIDASPLLTSFTGIAQYTRELAQRVMRTAGIEAHFCYGLYWDRALRSEPVRHFDEVRRSVRNILPGSRIVYRTLQQAVFSAGARSRHIDVYHSPIFLPLRFPGPTVVTVHDLSHIRFPETHPADRVRVLQRQLPRAIERARYVLVDSDFVRREVLATFGTPADRVVTISLGVSLAFRRRVGAETAAVLSKHGLASGRYVLSVGTLEPRKNVLGTLEAYCGLPESVRKAYPLVLVGAKGWKMEATNRRLAELVRSREIRRLGYVPQEELPILYAGAAAFVYPSLYEGFGLPVLEAMASGVPVVTSNSSSLVEVAGDAALTVDPQDAGAIRAALHSVLEESAERSTRIARGIEWARRFTWERCAEQTVAVYRDAARA